MIHLREQMHRMKQAYEKDKQDLLDTNHHYKQILQSTQQTQKLPKVSLFRGILFKRFLLILLEIDSSRQSQ